MTDQMKEVVLAARPQGAPKLSDFRIEEKPVPDLPVGGIVVRVLWQSLDPYMRGRMDESKSYAAAVPIGGRMEAGCVGEVIATENLNPFVAPAFAFMFGKKISEEDVQDGRIVRLQLTRQLPGLT